MNIFFLRYALVIFLLLGFACGTGLRFFAKSTHESSMQGPADQTESAPAGSGITAEADTNDYLTAYHDLLLSHPGSFAGKTAYAAPGHTSLPARYLAILTPPPDFI